MASKRKRLSYDASFKLKIIGFAEENGNRAAESKFTVSKKLVRDWCKSKESLLTLSKMKKA